MDFPRRIVSFIRTQVGARRFFAYVLLSVFLVCSTVGAALIYPPAGWLTAGGCSLIAAYLLGAN